MAHKKVIIVGGGVAGLTLALALENANIDYVLLESHAEFAPQVGASVIVWGCGLRIADQLGLRGEIEKISCAMSHAKYMYEDNTLIREGNLFSMLAEQTGYQLLALERTQFMDVLYTGVKDKSKCLSNTKVESYEEDDTGVTVKCTNGTTFTGDLLVAADGINSKVRELMLENVAKEKGDAKLVPGFYAEFSCVFGISQGVVGLPAGTVFNIHGNGRSFMFTVVNDGKVFFFLYESIPVRHAPNIPKYTPEDAIKSMESASNVHIANGVTSGDVYAKRTIAVKVPLEESMCHTMSFRRTCLIGDSLHKMTPNDGFGALMAMEGAVCVANQLKKLYETSPSAPISTKTLEDLFARYEKQHKQRAQKEVSESGTSSRLQAGTSVLYRVARWAVLPNLPISTVVSIVTKRHLPGVVLEYLPKPQHTGLSKYNDEI